MTRRNERAVESTLSTAPATGQSTAPNVDSDGAAAVVVVGGGGGGLDRRRQNRSPLIDRSSTTHCSLVH